MLHFFDQSIEGPWNEAMRESREADEMTGSGWGSRVKGPVSVLLAMATIGLWPGPSPAQEIPPGWYATSDGRHQLVSPAPGGGFRRLAFDAAAFGSLRLATPDEIDGSGEAYRWIPPTDGGPALVGPDGARWTPWAKAPYELRPLRFRSSDGVELAGLLLLPREQTDRGAVILHGSGDSDRDNVWAYTFAHALAARGVAVLFFDKRGSGESGGDWRSVGLDALARDGVAAFDRLVDETGVAASCTGWVGLSQGGWVAPLAAAISGRGGYDVSVSSAAVPVFEQISFEIDNALQHEGITGEALDQALDLQARLRAYATGHASWDEYAAARADLLQGSAAPFAEAMPATRDDWRWAWWARVGPVDPLEAWARAGVPTLVLYGAEDENDNVPVGRSVSRLEGLSRRLGAEPQVTWEVYPGLGHALFDEDRGWISSVVLDRIVEFVQQCPGGG